MVDDGETAPDFTAPDADGRPFHLHGSRGRPVVLFFYPRDFTRVCTRENCAFRDEYSTLRDLGAEVIGVSPDPPERHARFAARHRLPFRQLSDADGRLRRLFGVRPFLGLIPGRVTFVIDGDGVVRKRFKSQYQGEGHARMAVEAVQGLAATQTAQ